MINPLLKPTDEQRKIALETVRRLAPRIDQIIHHWATAYREVDRTMDRSTLDEMKQMCLAYFKMLL